MGDHLERIRDNRDRRAFNTVAVFVVSATGWLVAFVAIAARVLGQ